MTQPYDSTAGTLRHSLRVGELMGEMIRELVDRSTKHDLSKTEPPEVEVFNEYTPRLRDCTYGSDEYKGYLAAMKPVLDHHYAANRHHPEHFSDGVDGMTLVDLIEMLADWKAATERHADGDLGRSLGIQRDRFGIGDQLAQILRNTAEAYRWVQPALCGAVDRAPNGERLDCNQRFGHSDEHFDADPYADVRPPDGECWCGGCVGMGPCDDDLCRADDDGWALDHDDWNDEEDSQR